MLGEARGAPQQTDAGLLGLEGINVDFVGNKERERAGQSPMAPSGTEVDVVGSAGALVGNATDTPHCFEAAQKLERVIEKKAKRGTPGNPSCFPMVDLHHHLLFPNAEWTPVRNHIRLTMALTHCSHARPTSARIAQN